MVKIYRFQEHDVVVQGEAHHLLELAEFMRENFIEGTWSDLIYQIEYAFDVDGIRSENDDGCAGDGYEDNYLVKGE